MTAISPTHRGSSRPACYAAIALALLLVSNGPLFLAMPLTADTVLYDLEARNLVEGGVQYRDIFEPNLPGVVWLHAAIRTLLGTSSEAMRIADLLIFSGIVWLLARWVRSLGGSKAVQVWTAVVLYWFYFCLSDWCHCQRDTWMLLPGLLAFGFRHRQTVRIAAGETRGAVLTGWALAEGACWGLAFWLKPFIAVPALCCWMASTVWHGKRRLAAIDFAGLICGGLLAGLLGVAWLCHNGAWPYFLETFLEWNPEYLAARAKQWSFQRVLVMARVSLYPWLLLHVVAVPVAVSVVVRALRAKPASSMGARCRLVLFAAFYLGWLLQACCLQHPFDYIQAPAIVLAISLLIGAAVAAHRADPHRNRLPLLAATAAFVVLALLASPVWQPARLGCWWNCVTQGSTPAVRDRLGRFRSPEYWRQLDEIVKYLRNRHVSDGQVTCLNVNLVDVYSQLELRPSTRYVFLEELMDLFPTRHALIEQTLADSRQRYVVTDLLAAGLSLEEATAVGPDGPAAPPPAFPRNLDGQYPWSHRVVFRSGRFMVHVVGSPMGRFQPRLPPGRRLLVDDDGPDAAG